ncbi:hypothetical protein AN1V17_11920 [Vallitalea sediminicola]
MSDYCIEHATAIKENEQRSKSNQHRIETLEENQKILHDMNKNIAVIAKQTTGQDEQIKEVKNDVKELKDKPIKRWDLIVATIITAVTTALATAIVAGVIK